VRRKVGLTQSPTSGLRSMRNVQRRQDRIGRRAAATAAPVATSARAAACFRHSESSLPRATLVASLTTLPDFYLKGARLPCSLITPPRCPPSVQLLFCSLTDFSNLSVAALLPALEPLWTTLDPLYPFLRSRRQSDFQRRRLSMSGSHEDPLMSCQRHTSRRPCQCAAYFFPHSRLSLSALTSCFSQGQPSLTCLPLLPWPFSSPSNDNVLRFQVQRVY
jgi:hypothetical protein